MALGRGRGARGRRRAHVRHVETVEPAPSAATSGRIVDVPTPRQWSIGDELADEDISILVNNAGVAGPVAPLIDVVPDEWDDVFATNVRGMFLMCRAFFPP